MQISGCNCQRPELTNSAPMLPSLYGAIAAPYAALERYATLAQGWDFEAWERQRAAEKLPPR